MFVLFLAACLGALALAGTTALNLDRTQGRVFETRLRAVVDRSNHIRANARPTYQDEILGSFPASEINGPVFRLDERFSDATVVSEPPRGEGADAMDMIFSWEFDDAAEPGLAAGRGRSSLRLAEGLLVVDHDSTDYLTNGHPLEIPKDEVGEITIAVRSDRAHQLRLAWSSRADPREPPRYLVDIPLIPDGIVHTYSINGTTALRRELKSGDVIRQFYLKASGRDGRIALDFVRFESKLSRFLEPPRGLSYETVAKQMRRVLFLSVPQRLEYTVRIPENDPILEFGTGISVDRRPVTFSVDIDDGVSSRSLYRETIDSTARWRDARISLASWAGRDVKLSLGVEGPSQRAVGFWSNPAVFGARLHPFRVVIVLEDTLRADHLPTYGYPRPTAPFKDRLVSSDGIVFLNAVSQATMTRPSVASMMTSLLPSATNVWKFTETLSDQLLTLPEVMRQQGFVTASFIQNGSAGPYAGLHQGFSFLFDEETTAPSSIGTDVFPRPEELFGDPLMRWVEQNRDRNFFLYLHVTDPHGPYEPPPVFREWYAGIAPNETLQAVDREFDPAWVGTATVEGRRALYDGEIRRNDALIEEFVDTLKRLGLYERTLLLFVSDHGEHLGERGLWGHYDPGYRQVTGVQFMMVYPERFEGGRRIEETVQLLDVMPTMLELSGVDPSGLLVQGESLVDLVEGRRGDHWRDRVVISEEPTSMDRARPDRQHGLRVTGSVYYRGWHLISSRNFWPQRYVPEVLRMKVFDFAGDPHEERPLWSFAPDLYVRWRFAETLNAIQTNGAEAWRKWTEDGRGEELRYDPDLIDRLEALGYVH